MTGMQRDRDGERKSGKEREKMKANSLVVRYGRDPLDLREGIEWPFGRLRHRDHCSHLHFSLGTEEGKRYRIESLWAASSEGRDLR
jgi:hypothetical protein